MPTGSYTATEDCWACGYIEGDGGSLAAKIYVDTTQVIFTSLWRKILYTVLFNGRLKIPCLLGKGR